MLKLKITAIVCFILFFSCTCFAANSIETEKDSGYYYTTVDSDPGTGYSTAELTTEAAGALDFEAK